MSWFKPKERQKGVIKFFDRKKYFFHAAAIRGNDYRFLQDGVEVGFVLVQGRKGLQADDVMILSKKRANNSLKS